MTKLNDIFDVTYGNKFDLNKMRHFPLSAGGVNFVGRSSQNHGVTGTVAPLPDVPPYEAGLITVALGGTKLLSSFVQEEPFYTAQNVAVLRPKVAMPFAEKLFVCLCIRHNRFRYRAFGREANRTLRILLIPELHEFPDWVRNQRVDAVDAMAVAANASSGIPSIAPPSWRPYELQQLFDIRKGKRLTKANMTSGNTPFIGSTDTNNGVTARIGQQANHCGNTITVAYNGSVAEGFYQPVPFWATDDVNVLYPKFKMTPAIALFLITLIKREKYRFNYGRKWHLERMNTSIILLPVKSDDTPDWDFMECYIQSLPYSSQIE